MVLQNENSFCERITSGLFYTCLSIRPFFHKYVVIYFLLHFLDKAYSNIHKLAFDFSCGYLCWIKQHFAAGAERFGSRITSPHRVMVYKRATLLDLY